MRVLLLAALVLLPFASGCDTVQYACTLEFRTIQVRVVDALGRPIEGLQAQSVLENGGHPLYEYDSSDPTFGTGGFYTVGSDADLDLLSIDGDAVVFTATGSSVQAEARFVLADDGCHVTKEDGPTEITAVAL